MNIKKWKNYCRPDIRLRSQTGRDLSWPYNCWLASSLTTNVQNVRERERSPNCEGESEALTLTFAFTTFVQSCEKERKTNYLALWTNTILPIQWLSENRGCLRARLIDLKFVRNLREILEISDFRPRNRPQIETGFRSPCNWDENTRNVLGFEPHNFHPKLWERERLSPRTFYHKKA